MDRVRTLACAAAMSHPGAGGRPIEVSGELGHVDDKEWLAGQFERWRPHLRGVAYGMLGSVSEADDAVQESWLRLDRSDDAAINDLRGWLTTVVGRICLDVLRARRN